MGAVERKFERNRRKDSPSLREASKPQRRREILGVLMVVMGVLFLTCLLSFGGLLALGAVPPILDLVVAAVGAQVPGDLCPPLPALADHPHDLPAFFI